MSTRFKLHPSVRRDLYRQRIRNGWTEERAANEPAMPRRPPTVATINGTRTAITEVMRQSGVGVSTFYSRRRTGWSVARAASTPPGRQARPDSRTESSYEYRGKRMSLNAWAKETGVNYRTLLQRINRGLSIAEAIEHPHYGKLPKR